MTTHKVTLEAAVSAQAEIDVDALAVLTPNQVIAHNLRQARVMRGLTQEQAAERLEPFIGKRWSKASWSSAERTVTGERPREFTMDELIAFASCFELPPRWFMTLPAETREVALPGPAAKLPRDDYGAMVGPQHVSIKPATETETAGPVTAERGGAVASGGDVSAHAEELDDALRDASERLIQLAGAVRASASMTGKLTVEEGEG